MSSGLTSGKNLEVIRTVVNQHMCIKDIYKATVPQGSQFEWDSNRISVVDISTCLLTCVMTVVTARYVSDKTYFS